MSSRCQPAVRQAMLYTSSRALSLQSGTWRCDAAVGPCSLLPIGGFAFLLRLSSLSRAGETGAIWVG